MKNKNELYIDETNRIVVLCTKHETGKCKGSFEGIVIASHAKVYSQLDYSRIWSSLNFTPFNGKLVILQES